VEAAGIELIRIRPRPSGLGLKPVYRLKENI